MEGWKQKIAWTQEENKEKWMGKGRVGISQSEQDGDKKNGMKTNRKWKGSKKNSVEVTDMMKTEEI